MDLIFTEGENRIDHIDSSPPLGGQKTTTHLVLSFSCNLKVSDPKPLEYKKTKLMYKMGDYENISEHLNNVETRMTKSRYKLISISCNNGQKHGKCLRANQTEKAVNAAKVIIAQLRNSFPYFDPELVTLLYVSLVKPHLEYAIPVWNPYLRKVILVKKATERDLKHSSLETRRKRGDLIQFYKALNRLDIIEWLNELLTVERRVNVRHGGVCFHREPANISTERDQFFIKRVIPLWNTSSGKRSKNT